MNLYLLSLPEEDIDLEMYDSCVVCAESESDAKTIASNEDIFVENQGYVSSCKEIGKANDNQKRGVIIASYCCGQ